MCSMLEVLFASMSQKSQASSLYDVLIQRYRSCKTVARVLKFGCYGVAWELEALNLGSLKWFTSFEFTSLNEFTV